MPDILTGSLSRIPDARALEDLASDLNARADFLACDDRSEAQAWSSVYRILALSAESALIQRKTGIAV